MSLTLLLEKYDVSTEDGLQKALSEIEKEESEVNDALASVMSRACTLEGKLRTASQAYTKLNEVKSDAEQAADMVNKTAELARDVSAKVRQLDLARSRVAECQRRVHDLIDLRVCSAGVEAAIKAHDYETAAGHVGRFLSMEPGSVAAARARGGDPRQEMAAAAATLREHLVRKFEEAAKKEDDASVERLFKLFPQIGCIDEGIELLAKYLATQLEVKIRRAAVVEGRGAGACVDALTVVLEAGAAAVERARALLPPAAPPAALPRALALLQPPVSAGATRACAALISAGGAAPELALAHSRLHLYCTFLRRRPQHLPGLDENGKKVCAEAIEKIIAECELTRTAQDVLSHYLALERNFLEDSVSKALKLSTTGTSSSLVDDVFFLARKVISRSISTGSVDGVCAALNECGAQLERCAAALRRRLAAPPPQPLPLPPPPPQQPQLQPDTAYTVLTHSHTPAPPPQPLPLPPPPPQQPQPQLQPDTAYTEYIVEAETGAEWAERLADEAVRGAERICGSASERDKLVSCAGSLGGAAAAFRAARELGVAGVRGALQPALAGWAAALARARADDEEEAAALPAALDALAAAARDRCPGAADALLAALVSDLVARADAAILDNYYDRAAALCVERRARRLAAWAGGGAGGARERCAALCAAAAALAADRAAPAAALSDRLTPRRVRELLARRTDIKLEDIKRMKI